MATKSKHILDSMSRDAGMNLKSNAHLGPSLRNNGHLRTFSYELLKWLPVGFIPIFNGIIRMTTYGRILGDFSSSLISSSFDIALIIFYAILIRRRETPSHGYNPKTRGFLWVAASTLNHFMLGHFGFGLSMSGLIKKYDIFGGETWLFISLIIFLAPLIASRKSVAKKKRVIILIGPKGSGKTTIGGILEKSLGIYFLRVEPLWLKWRKESTLTGNEFEKHGFALTGQEIANSLESVDTVLFESTGASPYFRDLLRILSSKYEVKMVLISADSEVCLTRVKNRDTELHIPVSDERVREINEVASKVSFQWDLKVENTIPLSEKQLTPLFENLTLGL